MASPVPLPWMRRVVLRVRCLPQSASVGLMIATDSEAFHFSRLFFSIVNYLNNVTRSLLVGQSARPGSGWKSAGVASEGGMRTVRSDCCRSPSLVGTKDLFCLHLCSEPRPSPSVN